MEASALRHASRSGLLARRSPLLRLQGDERLVALIRGGHDRAFEVLFDRYHARLLAFCRHMLRSSEDAEDVLQEVFAKAHMAMLADRRPINVRPWLYRIARNRCLNHLRKPVPEGQESMDIHPSDGGTTTAERVQRREDFRALVADVQELPETQRTALLLREIDALSYEDIAAAMDTTVAAVKSLLVRARMSLTDAGQARMLTCGDARLELAEAAEGLRKVSGPVRHHIRACQPCGEFRRELRSTGRALAALAPAALIVWAHKLVGTKLVGAGAAPISSGAGAPCLGAAAATAGGAGGATAGSTAAGGGAAIGGAAVATGGGLGGAIATKAAAGIATAALLTAGAVEVRHLTQKGSGESGVLQQGVTPPFGGAAAPVAPFGESAAGESDGSGDEGHGDEARDDGEGRGGEDEGDASAAAAPIYGYPVEEAPPGQGDATAGGGEKGSSASGGQASASNPPGNGCTLCSGPVERPKSSGEGPGGGTSPGDPGPPAPPGDPGPPVDPGPPISPGLPIDPELSGITTPIIIIEPADLGS